jgi:hypothetical protein
MTRIHEAQILEQFGAPSGAFSQPCPNMAGRASFEVF